VLTRDHTVLLATHTYIHEYNELSCLYSPAATHHRTLAGTQFPSHRGWEAELAWVAGYIPRWYARPKTVTHPCTNRPIVLRPGIEVELMTIASCELSQSHDDSTISTGTRNYYFARGSDVKYCNEPVCVCLSVYVSVCPRGYLPNHTRDLYQIFVYDAYGRGSVLLQWGDEIPRRRDILGFSFPSTRHCTA